MVELRTSSTFRGWVRVRVLGYGSGVRGRKVKSRDCALASDLVRATGDRGKGTGDRGQGSLGQPDRGQGQGTSDSPG